MKRLIPEFTLLLASFLSVAPLFAQGGWTHITDANNDISGYTSTAGYVGVAWIDIDNDGHIDLFAAPSSLYYNNGNGKFSPIPNFIGSGAKQPPAGCSWADLDNDGNVDCVLASFPSAIYYGDGGGSFTNVTAQV